jgi:hypothetical protein
MQESKPGELRPEELAELFIGIKPGLWCIVLREKDGRPYVVGTSKSQGMAESFAGTIHAQVVRKPPPRATEDEQVARWGA